MLRIGVLTFVTLNSATHTPTFASCTRSSGHVLQSCVPVHHRACHPWPVPEEQLLRSSLGTRVHLHRCQPGCARFVHSVRSRQVSRMSHHSRQTNGFDSLLQLHENLQLEVCSLGPSSASDTGHASVSTCHSTRTHSSAKERNRLSPCFLSAHCCLPCPCLSPCLSLSCPSCPSLRALHLPNIHRR